MEVSVSAVMSESSAAPMGSTMFEEALQALTDREGTLELQLDGLQVELPFIREAVRLSGTVRIRVHMHETPPTGTARARRRA